MYRTNGNISEIMILLLKTDPDARTVNLPDPKILELCAAALANPEPEKLEKILGELQVLLRESTFRAENLMADTKPHQPSFGQVSEGPGETTINRN